jgi:hypothetical protein
MTTAAAMRKTYGESLLFVAFCYYTSSCKDQQAKDGLRENIRAALKICTSLKVKEDSLEKLLRDKVGQAKRLRYTE